MEYKSKSIDHWVWLQKICLKYVLIFLVQNINTVHDQKLDFYKTYCSL